MNDKGTHVLINTGEHCGKRSLHGNEQMADQHTRYWGARKKTCSDTKNVQPLRETPSEQKPSSTLGRAPRTRTCIPEGQRGCRRVTARPTAPPQRHPHPAGTASLRNRKLSYPWVMSNSAISNPARASVPRKATELAWHVTEPTWTWRLRFSSPALCFPRNQTLPSSPGWRNPSEQRPRAPGCSWWARESSDSCAIRITAGWVLCGKYHKLHARWPHAFSLRVSGVGGRCMCSRPCGELAELRMSPSRRQPCALKHSQDPARSVCLPRGHGEQEDPQGGWLPPHPQQTFGLRSLYSFACPCVSSGHPPGSHRGMKILNCCERAQQVGGLPCTRLLHVPSLAPDTDPPTLPGVSPEQSLVCPPPLELKKS